MAQIQDVSIWYDGENHFANTLTLYSDGDNLIDSASFKYSLIENIETEVGIFNSKILISGFLSISGIEYNEWDSSISANTWIYNWAASKLNLTII